MDKTTAILGGVYGGIVLLLVFVFFLSPQRMEIQQHDITSANNLDNSKMIGNSTMSLADLFAKSDSGVVQITVEKLDDSNGSRDIGSGFVYDLQGHIITNNHVVENAKKITVTFSDENSYNATVVGTDPFSDIAVVKVGTDPLLLHPLSLGNSSALRIGDEVAAIGNPFGLTGSMTSGIVSQTGRLLETPDTARFSIPDVIQTDAPINPGNSGGPLLEMNGKVAGMNTAIQSETGQFSGVGFAIPSDTLSQIVPILIQDGHYKHPWLGISGVSISPDIVSAMGLPVSQGFLVEYVAKDSPAEKAGLHGADGEKTIDGIKYKTGGDIILGIDDKPVKKIEDILMYLQDQKKVGDVITLQIFRNGQSNNVQLTLQERPSQTQ